MIKFIGVKESLVRNLDVLVKRYPNDVFIEDFSECLKTITICEGVPVILKHYGFDDSLRIEIGSYLSDIITASEYVQIVIV